MHRAALRRPAFTLVELLVVITIIAILASFLIAAAAGVISRARQTGVLVEISQLDSAMQECKNEFGSYPPCMADRTLMGTNSRQERFMRFLAKAFPRYIVPDSDSDGDRDYIDARAMILARFNYLDASNTQQDLDLDDLDQAEALVFFLAGPPAPREDTAGNVMNATSKVFGFHADPQDPFRVGLATDQRQALSKLYDFNEDRLVDRDGDGWLEYIPNIDTSVPVAPPYVYFDAALYTTTPITTMPTNYLGVSPPDTTTDRTYLPYGTGGQWGLCVPYVQQGNPFRWANAEKFQIICAGFDGLYGDPNNAARRRIFPIGTNYDPDGADLDNLTNFSERNLEDAQP